jgi:ferredoxin
MDSPGALFEAFLNQHDTRAWTAIRDRLLPAIHEVDRNATRIWFAFYPLELAQAVREASDPAELERRLWLQGRYRLVDHIGTSHRFLYGHRYWTDVTRAVLETARSGQPPVSLDLAAQVRRVAAGVAARLQVDESLLVGVTAVAFMTVQQVGLEAVAGAPAPPPLDARTLRRTPEQVVARRACDDRQGLFGFLRGVRKEWTVTFDETDGAARFRLIHTQELTTAAAGDRRDYRARDPRCQEGPIPVQCRSAFCGTCWVGVLGGAEKLSPVASLERTRIREFGYLETDEPRPLIRLACQAQAFGAVSIVIPPWNGILGRFLRERRAGAAEPVT